MKLSLPDREALAAAFALAASASPAKTAKPILQSLLLTADTSGVTVRGTDLDVDVSIRVDGAEVTAVGSALMPARAAAKLLHEKAHDGLPDHSDAVVIESDRTGSTTIAHDGGRFDLLGMDPGDFPDPVGVEGEPQVTIAADQLAGMIRRTTFAAATEESKYSIGGVLFEVTTSNVASGKLAVVATDGRRMAVNTVTSLIIDGTAKAIIPVRALAIIAKACDAASGDVEIRIGETQATFHVGAAAITTQLLEGNFLDYAAVIPKGKGDTVVDVDRAALVSYTRKMAVVVARDLRTVTCRLDPDAGEMILSASGSDVGRGEQRVAAKIVGKAAEVMLDAKYLADAIESADCETVRLCMFGSDVPVRMEAESGFRYILMPVSGA